MAKSKKTDEAPIESFAAADLIALLTPPGCDGRYENELVAFEQDFEEAPPDFEDNEAAIAATSLQQLKEALKPSTAAPQPPKSPSSQSAEGTQPAKPAPAARNQSSMRLNPVEEIPGDSLEKIAAEVAVCQKCDLCKTRKKTVPGVGNPSARLVFIGEAPGADEDATGIPFVGRAGQHLDKILAAAGFKREDVFICNILKCRPPENRDPTIPEMVVCTPYLQRQLRLIQPALIACLGNVAVKFVIGAETPGITRVHGQWFQSIFNIPAMALYHPSYLLRSETREKGSPNWQMWQDIQALKKRYDDPGSQKPG